MEECDDDPSLFRQRKEHVALGSKPEIHSCSFSLFSKVFSAPSDSTTTNFQLSGNSGGGGGGWVD